MENRVRKLEQDYLEMRDEMVQLRTMQIVTENNISQIKSETAHISKIYSKLDEVNQRLAEKDGASNMLKYFVMAMVTLIAGAGSVVTLIQVIAK